MASTRLKQLLASNFAFLRRDLAETCRITVETTRLCLKMDRPLIYCVFFSRATVFRNFSLYYKIVAFYNYHIVQLK